MINDYFRNEFNKYLKESSTNVKREEVTLCYNDHTLKRFDSSECISHTINETSVNIFQDRNGDYECDLFKHMLENVLKIEDKETDLNGICVSKTTVKNKKK